MPPDLEGNILQNLFLCAWIGKADMVKLYRLHCIQPLITFILDMVLVGVKSFDVLDFQKSLFCERRSVNRKRSILTGMLECLPEIVLAGTGLDIAFRVLDGSSTVGDYSLYTGLLSQLWNSVYTLSDAVMQIYDNQLKIKNIK